MVFINSACLIINPFTSSWMNSIMAPLNDSLVLVLAGQEETARDRELGSSCDSSDRELGSSCDSCDRELGSICKLKTPSYKLQAPSCYMTKVFLKLLQTNQCSC